MFEATQEKPDSGSSKLWIGVFVVLAVVALGVLYYTMTKGAAKDKAVAKAAAAKAVESADPVKDLKILRATMQKDANGAATVWSVTLENRSDTFSYSQIQYQTDYLGGDDRTILSNQGVLSISMNPGAEQSSEIRDSAYPAGTARYKFKITNAKATKE